MGSLHPDVPIYSLGLDLELDDRYFIVSGLGGAGDSFWTLKLKKFGFHSS